MLLPFLAVLSRRVPVCALIEDTLRNPVIKRLYSPGGVRLQPDRTVNPLSRRFGFYYTAHMYSIKCDLPRRLDKECPMVQTQPPTLLEQVRDAMRTRH